MREIITKVYSFDELESKTAKENALGYVSSNLSEDWEYLGDYLECEAIEKGFAIKMSNSKSKFPYSQEKYVRNMEEYGKAIKEGFTANMFAEFSIYHKDIKLNAFHIETDELIGEAQDEGNLELEDELAEIQRDKIEELGAYLLRLLEEDYEYSFSEEATKEYIEANELEFYVDGSIV